MTTPDIRCTTCGEEFLGSTVNSVGCPKCGTESVPMTIADDVTVKINWHELRILGIWAEHHARTLTAESMASFRAVIRRLQAQHPTKTPLTLSGEVAQMQRDGLNVELRDGSGKIIVPKIPTGSA